MTDQTLARRPREFELSQDELDRLEIHPLAQIFPQLKGDEMNTLVADICANGLREAIWLFDKQVLDGRNRLFACREAQRKPRFREFNGDWEAARKLVFSANLARRDMDPKRRQFVAARLANIRNQ